MKNHQGDFLAAVLVEVKDELLVTKIAEIKCLIYHLIKSMY